MPIAVAFAKKIKVIGFDLNEEKIKLYKTGIDPSQYIEEKGLKKISGQGKLKEIAQKIINNNPEAVEDYRQGKEEAVKFLLGQIMRETKGKADPQQSREIIVDILKE